MDNTFEDFFEVKINKIIAEVKKYKDSTNKIIIPLTSIKKIEFIKEEYAL